MLYRGTIRAGIAIALFASFTWAQAPAPLPQSEIDSFELVWTTIRDSHWETRPGGLDWNEIYAEFRPRVERAATPDQAREITREMLARLHQTHFRIVPAAEYLAGIEQDSGTNETSGSTGIDLRVIDGSAVVTSVVAGSPAGMAGVQPGWILMKAAGTDLHKLIEDTRAGLVPQPFAPPNAAELQLTRALQALLRGKTGTQREVVFLDGLEQQVQLSLDLVPPRGQIENLGDLPPRPVWYEDRQLPLAGSGFVDYLGFNFFLTRTMFEFEHSVAACGTKLRAQCRGLIVDLRGNPGGLTATSARMAGSLLDQPNQKLGTILTRRSKIDMVVVPLADRFSGPVAILIDANSASTSEILAAGLQDLHRARIFGTHSAGAALVSQFEILPNGDHFQYATANYISQGGKALEAIGVTPDEEVHLTRESLLAGHDEVVEAAERWIAKQTEASAQ